MGQWRFCQLCMKVIPVDSSKRWDWHADCTVFDRPGRPERLSRALDFASHRKAYHPMKAVKRISEAKALRMIEVGEATNDLSAIELLGREGRK